VHNRLRLETRGKPLETENNAGEKPKLIKYFVNAEVMETTEHLLTVEEILKDANFVPVDQFELSRDSDGQVFEHKHHEVTIREGERFTAKFHGPTPTS
jgi:hypothetical protein